MKATSEYRRWMNKMRKQLSGKNGNISAALMDNPKMEQKMQSGKKHLSNKRRRVDTS